MRRPASAALSVVLLAAAVAGSARAADLRIPPSPSREPGLDAGWTDEPAAVAIDGRAPPRRPARAVTGGPGYVGSDFGLGKPAYYGLGTRPDWGRSSAD